MINYYEVLGVSENSSQDEIKSSYRKLAKEHHPDRNHGKSDSSDAEFKKVQEAYEVLSDEEKRKKYDRMRQYGDDSINDPFASPFADFFNRVKRQPPEVGQDVMFNLTCSFEETITGVDKKIDFISNEICRTCDGHAHKKGTSKTKCYQCNGSGQVISTQNFGGNRIVQIATVCPVCVGQGSSVKPEDVCPDCNRGLVENNVSLEIKIPSGVLYGATLRILDRGMYSSPKGKKGHCFIKIIPEKHSLFELTNQYDIVLQLYINPSDAILGSVIDIPTVDGTVEKLNIPAGTNDGDRFVIRGKGLFKYKNVRADMIIFAKIETIKNNEEIKELIEKLKLLENEKTLPKTASMNEKIDSYLKREKKDVKTT